MYGIMYIAKINIIAMYGIMYIAKFDTIAMYDSMHKSYPLVNEFYFLFNNKFNTYANEQA